MYHQISNIVLCSLLLFFWACSQEEYLPKTEQSGIFAGKPLMKLDTISGYANFPEFLVGERNINELLHIIVLDEPIIVDDDNIQNTDAIVWEWHTGKTSQSKVSFLDGQLIDSTYQLNQITCLENPTLYWAAFTWDDKAIRIAASTVQHSFRLIPQDLPAVAVEQVLVIGEEFPDGYFQSNERITIKVLLKNNGTRIAKDITSSIFNERSIDLPLSKSVADIAPDQIGEIIFTFRLPDGLGLQEKVSFRIELVYNNCLSTPPFDFEVTITGRQICLQKVTLINIKSEPIEGPYWDALIQIGYWNPDPYFILSEEDNEETVFYSEVLQEVPPNNPQIKSWSPLDPCRPLKLDKLYTIQIFDKDTDVGGTIDNPDDFIGDVKFIPNQFLADGESVQTIESETLVVRLELEWR